MFEHLFHSGTAAFWTIVWGLGVVLQLGCIVHVLKTGRPYYWIFILFWFSYLAVAAYIFFEVRPSVGKFDLESLLWRMKSSDERIRIRREIVEDSGTIKNRLLLADELSAAGRHDEECAVLTEGLRGAFKDDAQLLLRIAEAQLDAGQVDAAHASVEAIEPERTSDFQMKLKLLRARVYSQQRRSEEAESLFAELIALKRNEAPRYYFAQSLLGSARHEEGLRILRDILTRFRRGTPVWRYQERRWYNAAKRLLKRSPAPMTPSASVATTHIS